MCSASISLFFVCKSCQRLFQNLNEFIEHKKNDHFPEFQKLHCIIFEENKNYSIKYKNLGNLPSTMNVAVKEEVLSDLLEDQNSNENTDHIGNDPLLVVQNYPPKPVDAVVDQDASADSTEFITADVKNEPQSHIVFEPSEFDFQTEHSTNNEVENSSNSSDNEPNFRLVDVKPDILEPIIEITNFENENESGDDDSYYHNSSANFYNSDAAPSTSTTSLSFDLNSILHCDLELDLECRLCHNVLSSEMELKTHVQACFLTSKKTASYCLDCNRHLPTSRELKLHKKQIHGYIDPNSAGGKKLAGAANKPPLFKCQHCTKQFLHEADLNQHSECHSAEFPFKCTTANCEKAFETLTKLKVHYVTHYNLQRFKCSFPHCNKSYKYKKSIVEHERVHTGERPYRCTEQHCDLTFFNSSELRRHKVSWHGQT